MMSGDDGAEGAAEAEAPNPLAVDNFRLSPQVKAVLKKKGIEALFDIQAQTLSHVLDGKDLLGRARYPPPPPFSLSLSF
jgi:ATP-dependent RNA helicase DDX21